MKKLLITGSSGLLGWHVCQQATSQWQVYGIYGSRQVEIQHTHQIRLDLRDYQALKDLFAAVQPDAVIHLAAQSQPNWCQQNPDLAYATNVTASWNVAGLCADAEIPCVFTSTDMVFDGSQPPYRETDPVNPINIYGAQKVAAEAGMRSRYPATAICRMPLMFGIAPMINNFLQSFLKTLQAGQTLNLFTDEFRTPVSATTAAQGLLLAVDKVQGTIHLGGKERLSRYEFGLRLVESFQLKNAQINACRQAEVVMPAPRPADVSLDSTQAFNLGYQPPTIAAELLSLRDALQV
jgi:dTDP-4-dehydrorhamnose reductase